MAPVLSAFERIAREASRYSDEPIEDGGSSHPFDLRNIHQDVAKYCKELFDNGHFAQSTFEAFKLLEQIVAHHANSKDTGFKLMMDAFSPKHPKIVLADADTVTGENEQAGYQFLFAGAIRAIRNPRGHEVQIQDSIDHCLDYLNLASLLLRRLEGAGAGTTKESA